jgi:hypothetical protein
VQRGVEDGAGVIRLGLACMVMVWGVAAGAAAQERLDSSIRAWADVAFYTGDIAGDVGDITVFTPVLRGEVELSSWQLGLDLPFAFARADLGVDAIAGASLIAPSDETGSGFGGRLGDPTLHFDYVVETSAVRGAVGLAVAVPTSDSTAPTDYDEAAGRIGEAVGTYSRGLWNVWWFLPDVWSLVVPASVEHVTSEHEIGLEGALAWLLPRAERADNQGLFQVALRAAMVEDPAVVGLRLQGVLGLDDRLLGEDNFQSSAELFAELRLPILWLGAGALIVLDEPLGIFGDGADMWSLRLSGGVGF